MAHLIDENLDIRASLKTRVGRPGDLPKVTIGAVLASEEGEGLSREGPCDSRIRPVHAI
jgi:hypothetical protein